MDLLKKHPVCPDNLGKTTGRSFLHVLQLKDKVQVLQVAALFIVSDHMQLSTTVSKAQI